MTNTSENASQSYTKGDKVTVTRGKRAGQVITIVASGTDGGYVGHNEAGELVLVATSNVKAVPEPTIGAEALAEVFNNSVDGDGNISRSDFISFAETAAPGITKGFAPDPQA